MTDVLSIEEIRARLAGPLPGPRAQAKMAPVPRPGWRPGLSTPGGSRQGGVLILLFRGREGLRFVLTLRTEDVRSHKGQISLPGGRREDGEPLVVTALRETEEELAVPREGTEILGGLTPLYIPPSGFTVHPFVGYRPAVPDFRADPAEVVEAFTVPVASLLAHRTRRVEHRADGRGDTLRKIPFFELEGRKVWGATAMILSEFAELLA